MARVLGLSMVISDGMLSTIALVPQVRDKNFEIAEFILCEYLNSEF